MQCSADLFETCFVLASLPAWEHTSANPASRPQAFFLGTFPGDTILKKNLTCPLCKGQFSVYANPLPTADILVYEDVRCGQGIGVDAELALAKRAGEVLFQDGVPGKSPQKKGLRPGGRIRGSMLPSRQRGKHKAGFEKVSAALQGRPLQGQTFCKRPCFHALCCGIGPEVRVLWTAPARPWHNGMVATPQV